MFKVKNSFITLVLLIVLFCLSTFAESKGGSSSSSGGHSGGPSGGGGRGFGGGAGRGGRFGGRRSQAAVLAGGAVAGGAVGYAAYQASHKGQISRFHSNPADNPAIGTGIIDDYEDYKTQESTYYNRGEGFGMSAFGILALILGIIGTGTVAYYCCIVGVPLWKDRQRSRRMSLEGHPLQETPSTATPSP